MKGEISMKTRLFQLLLITFSFSALQNIHAAAIKSAPAVSNNTLSAAKQPSPIEKALEQLKRGDSKQHAASNDKLKVRAFTSNQKEPTQHFLAEQNQQFNRLLQNIFTIQGS